MDRHMDGQERRSVYRALIDCIESLFSLTDHTGQVCRAVASVAQQEGALSVVLLAYVAELLVRVVLLALRTLNTQTHTHTRTHTKRKKPTMPP